MITKGGRFLVLPLLLVLVFGCGTKVNPNAPATVSGKVTYKGAPVTAGTVDFHPAGSKGTISGPIKSDGMYTARDLPTGEMVVTVNTEMANPNRKTPSYGGGKGKSPIAAPPGPPPTGGGEYVKIPAKYANPKTSGLTVTLNAGQNTKDIDLAD